MNKPGGNSRFFFSQISRYSHTMENVHALLTETLQNYGISPSGDGIFFLKSNLLSDSFSLEQKPVNIASEISKNVLETKYLIYLSIKLLQENGCLFLAGDNKENGKRLEGWMNELNLPYSLYIGHKARCVVVNNFSRLNHSLLEKWGEEGKIQQTDTGFYSQPGLFSWDRVDPASQLLTETLSTRTPLSGKGADFGCGYGYLSKTILENNPNINRLTGLDYDQRALTCYDLNMSTYRDKIQTQLCDLAQPYQHSDMFDFIIMNPPFHTGRQTLSSLGQSFIENAARNLRTNGSLWLVANTHLPYENTLRNLFSHTEQILQKQGFKIILAQK